MDLSNFCIIPDKVVMILLLFAFAGGFLLRGIMKEKIDTPRAFAIFIVMLWLLMNSISFFLTDKKLPYYFDVLGIMCAIMVVGIDLEKVIQAFRGKAQAIEVIKELGRK